jgi:hypothetical protein
MVALRLLALPLRRLATSEKLHRRQPTDVSCQVDRKEPLA